MIQLIGFDLDDTLWDLRPVMIRAESILKSHLESEVRAYEHRPDVIQRIRQQLIKDEPELRGKITAFRQRLLVLALLEHGISAEAARDHAEEAMEIFLIARNDIALFPGALDSLHQLQGRYTLCALSNGNADIKRLNLDHLFAFHYSAEDVGAPKPASNMFDHAMANLSISPSEMIYVGDHPEHDIDAAAKLGIHTVWLDHGKMPESEFKASAIIHQISDLPNAIAKIERGLSV